MYQTLINGTPEAVQQPPSCFEDPSSLLDGASPATAGLRTRLRSLAPYFRTALITGEAGTGKRRAARELHRLSHPDGPFVSYRPGSPASTAADQGKDRTGEPVWADLLQTAQGGTLVVEEVGDLSPSDQARLLQLLREPGWRNGGNARAQVIGTSRHEPRLLVTTGRLRQDLHAMFSAVDIRLQPLSRRPEDVEELAGEFLAEAAAELRVSEPRISREALDALRGRAWPGNVAELRTVVRRAVRSGGGPVLTPAAFEPPAPQERSDVPPARTSMLLQDAIEAHVSKALTMCGGNKLKTAELLGVSRSTLYRMLDGLAAAARCDVAKGGSGSLRP